MEFLNDLLVLVPVIAFAAPLIAFLVDTFKRFGLPDGYAPLISGVLNLGMYAALYFLSDQEAEIQTVIEAMYQLAPIILALFVSVLSTKSAHDLLEKVGIGFSYSNS